MGRVLKMIKKRKAPKLEAIRHTDIIYIYLADSLATMGIFTFILKTLVEVI